MLSGLPHHDNLPEGNHTELDPKLLTLRTWQIERLQRTHADFLTSKRYGSACRFFISDIYGSKDFKQRNRDIEYMYVLMRKFIPDTLLSLVRNAINLHNITLELDQKLLDVLIDELGMEDQITEEMYAEGYRICNNYKSRWHQIDLLINIGHQVEFSTRIPPIGIALRLAGGPAKSLGWDDLHDFLNRGYKSFKKVGRAKKFLETIKARELRILDQIFKGSSAPFTI